MTKNILAFLIIVIALAGCELPQSPDFKLDHNLEAALSKQKRYRFLGADAAFIDTTAKGLEGICANGKGGLSEPPKEIPSVGATANSKSSKDCEINLSDFDISTVEVQFQDTLAADLSDLPGEKSNSTLKNATLTINYINGLPLDLKLNMQLLDKNRNAIIDLDDSNDLRVGAAEVNDSGFVETGGKNESENKISLTEKQLKQLHKTRYMDIKTTANTSEKKAIRLRGEDSIIISLDIDADIRSTVN